MSHLCYLLLQLERLKVQNLNDRTPVRHSVHSPPYFCVHMSWFRVQKIVTTTWGHDAEASSHHMMSQEGIVSIQIFFSQVEIKSVVQQREFTEANVDILVVMKLVPSLKWDRKSLSHRVGCPRWFEDAWCCSHVTEDQNLLQIPMSQGFSKAQ